MREGLELGGVGGVLLVLLLDERGGEGGAIAQVVGVAVARRLALEVLQLGSGSEAWLASRGAG